jgi:hypothetical protein
MRNVDKAIEWMEKESKNPSQSWKGLCQSTCRRAYSMGPFGGSAREAWGNVNSRFKVNITNYKDKEWWQSVPRGAILYSVPPNSKYGHAWLANGDMTGWSVDYKRSGFIDLVEIRLKGWASYYEHTKGYIIGAQYYSDNDGFFKGLSQGKWDQKIPPLENVLAANENRELANAAVWRLACRLSDLGYGGKNWQPVKYEQKYPVAAMTAYNEKWAPNMEDKSQYGPKAHDRIFKEGK